MNLKRILKVSIVIFGILVLGLYLLVARYEPVSKVVLSERPQHLDPMPIREISTGFRAEQVIHKSSLVQRSDLFDNELLCLELLLANWSDRSNFGEFSVDLLIGDKTFEYVIEAASVLNNANRKICYDNLRVSDLFGVDDIRLVLRGISSPPGAAITAWTTTDLSAGHLVDMTESLASRSLVFHFVTEQVSEVSYRHAWILVVLSMLVLSTLAFTSSSERERLQSGVEDTPT